MNSSYSIVGENISVSYFADGDEKQQICGDHCHDKYEITYLLSASGIYVVEGSEHRVTRGTLMLISPMSYHKVTLDTDMVIEGYTIHFSKRIFSSAVSSMLDKITDGGISRGVLYPPSLVSEPLKNAFERFATAVHLNKSEASEYMRAILTEIVILISAADGERMTHADEELGARVANYLNSNIEKNISLDRLARRFFVSKYHLCRAFKSYSGTTVHAYVNHKKIIYAKGLIESGLTASRAAERIGFGDYSAFYRAYCKIVGKSPTAE